jgi:D-threonate/D-erythronate kinase
MNAMRLLADDLTGALDTAAAFVRSSGPICVYWPDVVPPELPQSAALDSGTRELGRAEAIAVLGRLAPTLASGALAFKKIDTLLRGHPAAELAACFRRGTWRFCVLAPAFPYQGRITRGGRQYISKPDGGWSPAGGDLRAELAAEGLTVQLASPGCDIAPGLTFFDAEIDQDLACIVAAGQRADGAVLWCGSSGLARALARGADAPGSDALQLPVLGLFGSDQPVTNRQLAACGARWAQLEERDVRSGSAIRDRLDHDGIVLASIKLPPGLTRREAQQRIGREMATIVEQVVPPRTLLVAGGETLRSLCLSLGAESLEVYGEIEPGLPRSRMRGGRWDGVDVVSKSGHFGGEKLWRDLLDRNGLALERA